MSDPAAEPVPSSPVPSASQPVRESADTAADKPKLFSSTMLMASGTLVSRILGMVRVLMVGWILTVSARQADMFSLASGLPNQAYTLLAGGVLNAILVPQLMRAKQRDADGGQAYSDRIVTLFTLLLVGITAILMIANPLVVRLMAPSWTAPALAAQLRSLEMLTLLCMPQVFFFGLFFLGGQILNSRGSFGPLMWAPVLNNVIQILMLGTYAAIWGFHTTNDTSRAFTGGQLLLLGVGSVVGVMCQTALLIPFLKKVGFRYRPRFDFLHTGLGSTAHMAKWALALVVIDQVNYLVYTRLAMTATVAGQGAGDTVFNNAMLISLVPHALLTVSLATALMPSLSKLAASAAWDQFTRQFTASLRTIYTAIIPIAVLLLAVGIPACLVAWPWDGVFVGWTLMILGIGLVPFTLRFLVTKGFNSMENTRTPFFTEILFVVVTCLVSVALILWIKVPPGWVAPSIALGYTLGYALSGGVSWVLLRRAVPGLSAPLIRQIGKLVGLSVPGAVIAGAICWLQIRFIPGRFAGLVGLVIALAAGIGVYWGLARLARIPEILQLEALIRSKLRKERTVQSGSDDDSTNFADEPTDEAPPVPRRAIDPAEDSTYLPAFTTDANQPILTGLAPLVPGALIANRYRLGELIGRIGTATRWSGVDEALSRPVFITAFANDESAPAILESARLASGVMDARFLRILDAGQDADGAYVIAERVDGRTLSEILRRGPLTGEESAWVVREVATALTSVHAMHLYHCRLDPTAVYILGTGSIKIAGLRIDQALTPRDTDAQLSRNDMEAMDVAACGGLLYACLTATWPGSAPVGLPASPRNADGLPSPVHVRPGTSIALDRLTHQILATQDPAHIGTARGIDQALTTILGSKDVSASLGARAIVPSVPAAAPGADDATPAAATGKAESARVLPAVATAVPADDADAADPTVAMTAETSEKLRHPLPPRTARMWSRIFVALVGLVVLALLTTLIVGLYDSAHNAPVPPPAPTAMLMPRAISTAEIFDSKQDGGSGWENDDQVPLAFDGDPTTAWMTEVYTEPIIPDKKPGVGLMFDLGDPVAVSRATIVIQQMPIAVTLYVPGGDPATVTKPDMNTIKTWTAVTSASLTQASTTLDFTSVKTRYVVVYITKLVDLGGGSSQADLAEVSFAG